jgi:formylglycine-generating enzyme required for sulfatase activity
VPNRTLSKNGERRRKMIGRARCCAPSDTTMSITDYDNFDLLILPANGRFQARVIKSTCGEASTEFDFRFSQDDIRRSFPLAGTAARDVRPVVASESEELNPRKFGAQLFDVVFAGPVGQALLCSLDHAKGKSRGLRIRLRLAAVPALAELPWEYLYATPLDRFLALSEETPIVRYLELPQQEAVLAAVPPLRILGIVSNPHDVPPLDVEREWTHLHDAVDSLQSAGMIKLERLQWPTRKALQERLGQEPIHILHFIGHGYFDIDKAQGGLAFESEDGVEAFWLANELAPLLHDHRPLRLVFLNACEGARSGPENAFAGLAQVLVQQSVPVVLAMQFKVGDEAAVALAGAFYGALAHGLPIDTAVSKARKALLGVGDYLEWGTPVLFSRSDDHHLLAAREGDALPIIDRGSFEPETILVPAGAFPMGSSEGAGVPEYETPQHEVTLPDYRIAKFPTTNREYAEFIRRNRHHPPNKPHWSDRRPPPDRLDHPVTGVSWLDATAYCRWLSEKTRRRYRLPTEAEWEKAARGTSGRRYPWGDDPDENRCQVGVAGTAPVTAHPAGMSQYGCQDMLGNAQEWTNTIWGSEADRPEFTYPYRPDDGREEPAAPTASRLFRVHRGGSYRDSIGSLRCTARAASTSETPARWRGFRVVMEL